jgi:putative DNA primase/helicase
MTTSNSIDDDSEQAWGVLFDRYPSDDDIVSYRYPSDPEKDLRGTHIAEHVWHGMPVPPRDTDDGEQIIHQYGHFTPLDFLETVSTYVLPAGNPITCARTYFHSKGHQHGIPKLIHYRGEFHVYENSRWAVVSEKHIRADLYRFLENAEKIPAGKNLEDRIPFNPNKTTVAGVLEALQAVTYLNDEIPLPHWFLADPPREEIGEIGRYEPRPLYQELYPAAECVRFSNVILHPETETQFNHSPGLLSTHALDYPYVPDADEPHKFLKFLDEIFDGDEECIDALQEFIGLTLTSDTSFQKMLTVIGPPRSGKGITARINTELVGRAHVANPTLAGLATNFGLSPLINKRVAIVSDARLGGRTDQAVITERLLSISGEDSLNIDRKYRDPYIGKLDTRFMIFTNELPRLTDASGALTSRMILLNIKESFHGRENLNLFNELKEELSEIANWALAGLRRLKERGHFIQPTSSQEALNELEELSSPVRAFVEDRCYLDPDATVEKSILYERWKSFARQKGHTYSKSESVFGRDLHAAYPKIRRSQPRVDGERADLHAGIGLKDKELPRGFSL